MPDASPDSSPAAAASDSRVAAGGAEKLYKIRCDVGARCSATAAVPPTKAKFWGLCNSGKGTSRSCSITRGVCPMTYLELAPAITAIRSRPEEFEFSNNTLHHLNSRHRFHFASEDDVQIYALCDCSILRASPDQARAF